MRLLMSKERWLFLGCVFALLGVSYVYLPNFEDRSLFMSGKYWENPFYKHPHDTIISEKHPYCEAIDLVYLWVNGSDPSLLHSLGRYSKDPATDSLLRDYNSLKYSMRSIDAFAPWIRNVYLVTNGQVPNWLNTSAERLVMVTHENLFKNKSHLPTFNSNAIEAELHNLHDPECFIYLNDDVMFTSHIWPSDFINPETGIQEIDMWEQTAPSPKAATSSWHASVVYSNNILNQYYTTPNAEHHYAGHECHFFQKRVYLVLMPFFTQKILNSMYSRWSDLFEDTSSHRLRTSRDLVLAFLHANVALLEYGGNIANRDQHLGFLSEDIDKNEQCYSHVRRVKPKCFCINDSLGHSTSKTQAAIDGFEQFMLELFPFPSKFEKQKFRTAQWNVLPEDMPFELWVPLSRHFWVQIFSISSGVVKATLVACWVFVLGLLGTMYTRNRKSSLHAKL